MPASRLYLAEIERAIETRRDFACETTLSGRGYLRLIERLRRDGWRVELAYLAMPSAAMSHLRVAERVAHGGHDIPAAAIERRIARSLRNLLAPYAPVVSHARCRLNSEEVPIPVFEQNAGQCEMLDRAVYNHLQNEARR